MCRVVILPLSSEAGVMAQGALGGSGQAWAGILSVEWKSHRLLRIFGGAGHQEAGLPKGFFVWCGDTNLKRIIYIYTYTYCIHFYNIYKPDKLETMMYIDYATILSSLCCYGSWHGHFLQETEGTVHHRWVESLVLWILRINWGKRVESSTKIPVLAPFSSFFSIRLSMDKTGWRKTQTKNHWTNHWAIMGRCNLQLQDFVLQYYSL